MQSLAKSIILQSMDDLYDKRYSEESIKFFSSGDFVYLADLAGMNNEEKIELLNVVNKISSHIKGNKDRKLSYKAGRAKPSPRSLPVPSHF